MRGGEKKNTVGTEDDDKIIYSSEITVRLCRIFAPLAPITPNMSATPETAVEDVPQQGSDAVTLAASAAAEKVVSKSSETTETEDESKEDKKKKKGPSKLNANGEHRLQTPWSLWFKVRSVGSVTGAPSTDLNGYQQSLTKLGTFDTWEKFWPYFAYLKNPDSIPRDVNVFLFRDTTTPAWESFPHGGCWILRVRKRNQMIDRLWEELVFACMGELLGEPDVVGVELSTRGREDFLSVWNKDSNEETFIAIGQKLKNILNLDETTLLDYKNFASAIKDGHQFTNTKGYMYAALQPASLPF